MKIKIISKERVNKNTNKKFISYATIMKDTNGADKWVKVLFKFESVANLIKGVGYLTINDDKLNLDVKEDGSEALYVNTENVTFTPLKAKSNVNQSMFVTDEESTDSTEID